MNDFVNECIDLQSNGFYFDKMYSFRVSRILADAPARSFVKACKNPNSYYACGKCQDEGEWCGRVIYPNTTSSVARTDQSFEEMSNKKHHTGSTILSRIEMGLVSQVPLDYLHLVCLGVTRKLFRQWVKGKLPHRLQSRDTLRISERLKKMRSLFPSEFQRKPRSLLEIDHYKGTEFRSLLLYTGVPALEGIISLKKYKHFLLFHTAMLILLSPKADNQEWNSVAKKLLTKFVSRCLSLYGPEFMVYNVHGLLHITDDALKFGCLDNASTFAFESFMQKLKSFIHSHNYRLEQVVKRILESEILSLENPELPSNETWVPTRVCASGNNCYMLQNRNIVLIRRLVDIEKKLYVCQYFRSKYPVEHYPIDSSKLGVYDVTSLSPEISLKIDVNDVLYKYVLLPYRDRLICTPLLHTIN